MKQMLLIFKRESCLLWQLSLGVVVTAVCNAQVNESIRLVSKPTSEIAKPNVEEYDVGQSDLVQQFKADDVPLKRWRIPPWQGEDKCGLNCLYAYLRLNGQEVNYDALCAVAGKIPDGGLSFARLEHLADHSGVPSEILLGDIAELIRFAPPVIIHLGKEKEAGHYICYAQKTDDDMTFLDGTSGAQFQVSLRDSNDSLAALFRSSTGYILVADGRATAKWTGSRWRTLGFAYAYVASSILALMWLIRVKR